jgi:hypothetical protein
LPGLEVAAWGQAIDCRQAPKKLESAFADMYFSRWPGLDQVAQLPPADQRPPVALRAVPREPAFLHPAEDGLAAAPELDDRLVDADEVFTCRHQPSVWMPLWHLLYRTVTTCAEASPTQLHDEHLTPLLETLAQAQALVREVNSRGTAALRGSSTGAA